MKKQPEIHGNVIDIDTIADLSVNDAKKLKEIDEIRIENQLYPLNTYIKIRKQVDKILNGIEVPEKGDFNIEWQAFKKIYLRLAKHMQYDYYAISEEGEKDSSLQKRCRNLLGGILDGKCICAGYANILKNVLSCVGIESRYITGERMNDKQNKSERTCMESSENCGYLV